MLVSLFSIFDPSVYVFSPWIFMFFIFFLLGGYWVVSNSLLSGLKLVFSGVYTELNSVLGNTSKKGLTLVLVSSFFMVFFLNFFALFPSVFTVTGHMVLTLTYSLLFWLGMIIFLLLCNLNGFLAHLVPLGTPGVLMPFMVLVELVSNIIRPITLSVRLAANMVAGHLLMVLLGGFILSQNFFSFLGTSLVGLVLTLLEMAVCFIQAYVFVTLLTLYSVEVH